MRNNNNQGNKRVLFVCVENAGRSQIAEGFFNKYAPQGFKSQSAGTKPVSRINPIVVEAMREVGIDISKQESKEMMNLIIVNVNKLIIDYLMKHKILGATVWNGVDGFGKRRKSTVTIEGITINMPLVIEIIDERSKIEPLLPDLKMMVDDNGIVTIHEVDVI